MAVTAIVEHPALDAARKGIKDELAAEGFVEGHNLDFLFESAQGNPATAAQIAQKFVGEKPDVIVPISTPSAQAVVGATKDIPVVFTAVTDPVGAKLVTSLEHPGGNVTGMSDLSPIGLHLDLIKEIMPDASRLGVIDNPGEADSVTLIGLLKKEAPARHLEIAEAPAPRSADVLAAAQSLVGDVDAIYVPTDNTVVTALEAIVKVGTDNQLPVFAGDTDWCRGARSRRSASTITMSGGRPARWSPACSGAKIRVRCRSRACRPPSCSSIQAPLRPWASRFRTRC